MMAPCFRKWSHSPSQSQALIIAAISTTERLNGRRIFIFRHCRFRLSRFTFLPAWWWWRWRRSVLWTSPCLIQVTGSGSAERNSTCLVLRHSILSDVPRENENLPSPVTPTPRPSSCPLFMWSNWIWHSDSCPNVRIRPSLVLLRWNHNEHHPWTTFTSASASPPLKSCARPLTHWHSYCNQSKFRSQAAMSTSSSSSQYFSTSIQFLASCYFHSFDYSINWYIFIEQADHALSLSFCTGGALPCAFIFMRSSSPSPSLLRELCLLSGETQDGDYIRYSNRDRF